MKKEKILLLAVLILIAGCSMAYADASQAKKFRHADKNKDGVVDRKEMKMEKRWEHSQKSRLNNQVEAKYDTNKDGYLDSVEIKEMLRDKTTLVSTNGQAKVDSPIEAQYDKNNDGIIDSQEAKPLLEELKQ